MGVYAKTIAAGIMALLSVCTQLFGWHIPGFLTEDWLTGILTLLVPAVVYLVPNKDA